ncbi:MAG: hypothetical protein ACRD1N_03095 [Terriglobia bacterium]
MTRKMLAPGAALLFALSLNLMAAGGGANTWKGYVTDTWCGLNRAQAAPTAECTVSCVKGHHAKYAFFNFADQKVYVLNPQNLAARYAGQKVVVKGTAGGQEQFQTEKGPATGAVITASSITPER